MGPQGYCANSLSSLSEISIAMYFASLLHITHSSKVDCTLCVRKHTILGPVAGEDYGINPLIHFSTNSACLYSTLFTPITTILSPLKNNNHCHQKRFLAWKYPQNAFAAGCLLWTPPGGSQRSPDYLARLWEGNKMERRRGERRGRKEKREEGKGREGREVSERKNP